MKRVLLVGVAAALLGACGGQEMVVHAPIGALVRSGTAPWLTVAAGPDELEVRGLDHKLLIDPSPDLSAAVQSQLRAQLGADYFPDLVVSCNALTATLRVDQDKAPGEIAMALTAHCSFWARGFDTTHDYKAQASAPVASTAGDQGYGDALPKLIADSSANLAEQLRSDLHRLK